MTNILSSGLVSILYSVIEILIVVVAVLIGVAFLTLGERKLLAILQKRIGPNIVGIFGILQPFADALKLVIKESVVPTQANKILFYLAPILTIILSLIGWAVIPLGTGLVLVEWDYSILYTFALSSLSIYGILLAGWSANSKYTFLGALRGTAQIISYELVLSTIILIIIILIQSLNYFHLIELQLSVWFIIPLLPTIIIFFICILAETNRTPFDLIEGESELVAGFFTEYSGITFVLFFLAEYCSIILISSLTQNIYLGGYNLFDFINSLNFDSFVSLQAFISGIKIAFVTIFFIWVRATLPRMRFDQLIYINWTGFLPAVIGLLSFILAYYILINNFLFDYNINSIVSIDSFAYIAPLFIGRLYSTNNNSSPNNSDIFNSNDNSNINVANNNITNNLNNNNKPQKRKSKV